MGDEIRAVYFDFDGVLTLDSCGSRSLFQYLHKEAAVNIPFDQFYSVYVSDQGKRDFMHPLEKGEVLHGDIWDELCERVGVDLDISLLNPAFRSTRMHNEMVYVAYKLAQAGYVVGMITDNPKERMDVLLERYELNKLFSPIIISADTGMIKREEKTINFTVASEKSSVPLEQSLFIDNSMVNVQAAQNHGMQSWMYDDRSLNDDFERRKETWRIETDLVNAGLKF